MVSVHFILKFLCSLILHVIYQSLYVHNMYYSTVSILLLLGRGGGGGGGGGERHPSHMKERPKNGLCFMPRPV